jgi:hypothetical protein
MPTSRDTLAQGQYYRYHVEFIYICKYISVYQPLSLSLSASLCLFISATGLQIKMYKNVISLTVLYGCETSFYMPRG